MLQPGTVVMQEKTLINNNVEKNNSRRLSVVIFSENIDGKDYVCSCPITSNLSNIKKHPLDYCYIPYLVLGPQKFSVVRIADLSLWSEDSVRSVDIYVDSNNLQNIYNSILKHQPHSGRENVFDMAKRYISNIDLAEEAKAERRRRKAERKEKKRQKIRNRGVIVNG